MNFADYFTFENFKELEATERKIKGEPDLPRNYAKLYDRLFGTAILKFIKDYDKEYGFPSIANSEGHITKIQTCLEKFFKGEELIGYEEREIPMLFYKVVSMSTFNFKDEEVTDGYLKEKYDTLVDKFTKGNFRPFDLSEDSCRCYDCDQHFKMSIDNWKPTFNNVEYSTGYKSKFVTPEPCIDKNNIELSVTFETGNLLISDWFKIPQFTETFQNDFEINSIKGRIESTQHHLEKANVLHLVLGNCSPSVFKKGSTLLFGREDEEIETPNNGFVEAGQICTDLWAVTIVEKNQLIKIVENKLAKKEGIDTAQKAEKIVEKYLVENKNNITQIQIEPGQYTLNYHGNYQKFSKGVEKEEVPGNIKPYFMLKQPQLVHKPKRKI